MKLDPDCLSFSRLVKLTLLSLFFTGFVNPAHAQWHPSPVQYIDNENWWNRNSLDPNHISPFASADAVGFGEMFVAPDLARGLLYLSFTAKSSVPGTSPFSTINFAAWDPVTSSLTGDIYSWSGVNHVYGATDPQAVDGYFKYEFLAANTPALTPGNTYMMFVTRDDYDSALLQQSPLGFIPGGDVAAYTSGWRLDTTSVNGVSTSKWTQLDGDFPFEAGFYGVDGPPPFTPPPPRPRRSRPCRSPAPTALPPPEDLRSSRFSAAGE